MDPIWGVLVGVGIGVEELRTSVGTAAAAAADSYRSILLEVVAVDPGYPADACTDYLHL
jgi:hypothetical protein